ncbi:MAG: hypothetical protein ABFD14_03920 [Anaerolineaceae bacterium]
MEWEIIISAIVGALAGVIGSMITTKSQQRKLKAESSKAEADANEQIRATVMLLIEPLKQRIAALEEELADWQDWAKRLGCQVKDLGHEPVPFKVGKKESLK